MKYSILILLAVVSISCKKVNNKNIFQGDIYIKLIDFHDIIYGLSDEKLSEFEKELKNPNQNEYSESEMKLSEYFKILIKHDLYKKPHFKLKTNEDEIINVYTNEAEYAKLEKELKNFDKDIEKITVKFKGNKIQNDIVDSDNIFNQGIYFADKIILVEKTKGVTDWVK